jgi:hypothetical protein
MSKELLIGKIQSVDRALKICRWAGECFLWLAAADTVCAVLTIKTYLAFAIPLAFCGLLLRSKQSRAAAIVGLSFAAMSFLFDLFSPFGSSVSMLLATFVCWVGIRGVIASFMLRGILAADNKGKLA